jgi:hypothetical protein
MSEEDLSSDSSDSSSDEEEVSIDSSEVDRLEMQVRLVKLAKYKLTRRLIVEITTLQLCIP